MTSTDIQPSPLHNLIRGCRCCDLRKGCQGAVPGEGMMPARVMFLGEAPGRQEDETGRPFQGDAGEYLNSLLGLIGLSRDRVYITNTSKCRPRGNRTPTVEEGRFCGGLWLDLELELVRPEYLVCMGVPASRWVWDRFQLGEFQGMEREHGQPRGVDAGGRELVILPTYHPAAGLHDTGRIRDIEEDFRVLGSMVRGEKEWWGLLREDEYPDTDYELLDEPIRPDVYKESPVAIDTEVVGGKLWSIQWTQYPGMAYMILAGSHDQHTLPPGKQVVHNWLFDSQYVDLPDADDTMVMAYNLQLPQGLKELAWRLCGMEMQSYADLVRPYRKEKVMAWLKEAEKGPPAAFAHFDGSDYSPEDDDSRLQAQMRRVWNYMRTHEWSTLAEISEATLDPPASVSAQLRHLRKKEFGHHTVEKRNMGHGLWAYKLVPNEQGWTPLQQSWPEPPELEETRWDNRERRLVTRAKKPQHISKKIQSIIRDVEKGKETKDGPVDPYVRWHNIDPRERAVVEGVIGRCPDGDISDASLEEALGYACRDPDAGLRVYQVLNEEIDRWGLREVYELDRATLPIAQEMMRNGFLVDRERLEELSADYLEQMKSLALVCQALRPGNEGFNPNADQQVARVVYEELGFPVTRLTETGLPSVTEKELKKVKHGIIRPILQYRHLAHIRDSFCETLPKRADGQGRLHPTIKITRTDTGRWSMAEPNLQQIPTRTAIGKAIRGAFLAQEGYVLLAVDFSQIEMRVAAYLTRCRAMIQMFQEGRDVHTETAAEVFGLPLVDAALPRYRYPCKTLGFGILYGLTAYGLSDQMVENGLTDWDKKRCEAFIQDYYRIRPEVKEWQQETISRARQTGYVRDLHGRIRFIPELRCPVRKVQAEGQRKAINMPVQSTAADIMKLAMVRLWKEQKEEGRYPGVKWLMAVHDELIFEVREGEVNEVRDWVVGVMESVVRLGEPGGEDYVPIVAESKVGTRWGEME